VIDSLVALFPRAYWWSIDPQTYVQETIVNWLDMEVDNLASTKMPILRKLSRHRNREVFEYTRSHQEWIDRITVEMYGLPRTDSI